MAQLSGLACGSLADAYEEKMRLGYYVMVADMAETWRLWETINAWWTEIEVFLITGVTNARTEAANTSIKQLKRTGGGTATPNTTKPVSSCAVPPNVRHEHQAQRPTSRRTVNSHHRRMARTVTTKVVLDLTLSAAGLGI